MLARLRLLIIHGQCVLTHFYLKKRSKLSEIKISTTSQERLKLPVRNLLFLLLAFSLLLETTARINITLYKIEVSYPKLNIRTTCQENWNRPKNPLMFIFLVLLKTVRPLLPIARTLQKK